MRNRLASVSIAFLASLFSSMVSAQSQEPFAQDIRAFQEMDRRNPPTRGEILFIGSSSFTRWGDAQKAFPNHPLINRAFGGSTLLDEARYVDEVVTPYAPKEVVLYCGENDFAADPKLDPIEVFGRFESLFTMIRHRTGTVPFVYVSMKPSPSRWELAPKFRQANALIEAFLKKQPDTTYVDVWPVMLLDGKPDPSIYVEDRLHMNEKGYERWTPLLEKTLL